MNRTIYCTDLDQMIDYATAFADGGWSGLRDAIKQERQRDMAEYQPDNEVSLWPRDDGAKGVYTGGGKSTDFEGQTVRLAVFITRGRTYDNSPIADLFLHLEDGSCQCIGIFKNDKGLSGSNDTHWVNIFDNRKDQGKGPPFKVRFNPKEEKPVAAGAGAASDDIPF